MVEILERVLSHAPNDPQTHTNLALLPLKQHRVDDAFLHYERALAARPVNLNLLNGLSAALIDTTRLAESEELINSIRERAPDDPDALLNIGNFLVRQEQFEGAEDVYRGLLRQDPENADAWTNLSLLLYGLYRYDDAEEATFQALDLRPGSPNILHNRANGLVAVGQLEEVLTVFDKIIPRTPDMPEIAFDRGLLSPLDGTATASATTASGAPSGPAFPTCSATGCRRI